jgi:hypothetical protein
MSAPSSPGDWEPPAAGSTRRRGLGIGLGVVLLLAIGLAFVVGRTTAPQADASEAATPVLDVEFDFIGAVHTWEQEGSSEDPFADVPDGELVDAGRTACLRATDPDMSFDGMLDLLGTSPHQTYAILAEASDKLCPSHRDTLDDIMDG